MPISKRVGRGYEGSISGITVLSKKSLALAHDVLSLCPVLPRRALPSKPLASALALVQLRALRGIFVPLVTAPLFRLGLETGIEAAIGAGSQSKGQDHDDRNQHLPPDASRLRRDQGQEEVLAADRRSLGARRRQGLQPLARLPAAERRRNRRPLHRRRA